MERTVCFSSDASNRGGHARRMSVQKPPPPADRRGQEGGLRAESRSQLTVVLKSVVAALTPATWAAFGAANNLRFPWSAVSISWRPALDLVAAYAWLQSGHHVANSPPGGLSVSVDRQLTGYGSKILPSPGEGAEVGKTQQCYYHVLPFACFPVLLNFPPSRIKLIL